MVEVSSALGMPVGDVQVLTPMRVGPLGTVSLNLVLQELLNPPSGSDECRWGSSTFRIGDKVMQTRNDTHSDVYNGDMGVVVEAGRSGIVIDFQGIGEIGYGGSQLESIEHCWCVTIHKSQGSEFDAGIVVMHDAHRRMLRRNLLYTALTRFSELAVVVGRRSAVDMAVDDAREQTRCTSLSERIRTTSELLASRRAS
jgi:exodeoxyribonuclease V alpha subunit